MTRRAQQRRGTQSSALLIERWFTALIGHLLADGGDLGAHLEHDALDGAPDRKITTRRAPRRQARQCGQGDTGNAVDQCIDIGTAHQGALLLLDPDAQQCRLRQGMLRISRSAWRLLPLAPQIS